MSNDIAGIADIDVMLVIGSNTTETHPVIGLRMKQAVKNHGAKILVADPRRIKLTEHAHLWLSQKPGTDGALINAMCHVILRENLADQEYIKDRTENFESFAESVKECTPEWAEKITGVPAGDIEEAAKIYGAADKAAIFYTMGITQHTSGTDNVKALANLALMTGNLGKPSAGLNPLRGQNNVQGASDMACAPTVFPGYQRVDNDEVRARFEELWGCTLSGKPGLTATEMSRAMITGAIQAMWVMGENPVMSDPNMCHAQEAFSQVKFLVVQDIFLTETAELADVVLPAAAYAEKEGTFTNTERRVQRVRQALLPPKGACNDLAIIRAISERMNPAQKGSKPDDFRPGSDRMETAEAEEVFNEITKAWPAVAGINYQRLEEGGIQWPCPSADHPGTAVLFENGFPRGLASFTQITWRDPEELPDAEYPFILTTGRVLYQYHTGTMTRRSQVIESADRGPVVEMNPNDVARLQLQDGEQVKVASRRGTITLPVLATDRISEGVTFIPFHYKEAAANLLTNDACDPECKIPEAKVCAVKVEKETS
ncbi:MAG: formate dehydrogenase [Desulfobacterales bacterium SG8_35_2]|nr:MAG: formate dehydrogenase [Desulfobacterales bacterium SG8_35_2]